MKGKTILIGSAIAAGVTAAYYFLIYRPAQQNASTALTNINQVVTSNQVQASPYEGKLLRSPDTGKVYLIKNGVKEWITSQAVMDKLGYTWAQVLQNVSAAIIDAIPTGASLSGINILGSKIQGVGYTKMLY